MAVNRKRRAPPGRRKSSAKIRDRLAEAEATLEAIRAGQVDALVVSGPRGEQTVTIEGSEHPYFVLLNAMGDGAALLDPGGAILFGNRSFGDIVGSGVETLSGSMFQQLVVPAERAQCEEFLREGARQKVAREFTLVTGKESTTPVVIALSTLALSAPEPTSGSSNRFGVLMAIITDLTYRKAAEATRVGLLERLISAEDDERRRIARELHDETGQSLTALLVGLRTIVDVAALDDARSIAGRLRDIAARTVDDVGRLARGLHPAVLDDKGLGAAARRYVGDYSRSFRTPVDFVAGELDTPPLPPLAAATMYRILQEALTNVARHARATKLAVEFTRGESWLELLVQDDGVGFDARKRQDAAPGLGLRGMRERVTLLGGSIQIDSKPKHGTTVRARVPAEQPPPRKNAAGRRRETH